MNKYILLTILLPQIAFAEFIEAKGFGSTAEEARKNAIVNAIKEKVGEVVVSKESVSDDFYDEKIIGHSNAYIKKVKVKEEKLVDGVYYVVSLVEIESEKLIDELKEKNVISKKGVLNGGKRSDALSKFDEKDVKKENDLAFEELVKDYLISPIKKGESIMEIEFSGDVSLVEDPIPIEFKSDEVVRCFLEPVVPFEMELKIGPSSKYISNFKKILNEIEVSKGTRITEKVLSSGRSRDYFVDPKKIKVIQHVENSFLYSLAGARIKIELFDRKGGLLDSVVTSGEYPTKFVTKFRGGEGRGLARESVFSLLPDLRNHQFFSGNLKVKAYIFLTKEQVEELDAIKVMETGEKADRIIHRGKGC